jgi:hypothetical protein
MVLKMNFRLLIFGVRTSKSIILIALLCSIWGLPSGLRAEMSDAEKKAAFIKTRETIKPVSKPSSSAKPRPKPRASSSSSKSDSPPRRRSKASPSPTPKKSQKSNSKKTQSPEPKKSSSPKSEQKPSKKTVKETPPPEPDPAEEKTAAPIPKSDDFILIPGEPPVDQHPPAEPSPTPVAIFQPTPAPIFQPQIPKGKTPAGRDLEAPILIEKSGFQEAADEEAQPKSFFGNFMKRWRYLSPSLRKAIDNAKVQRGRWKYIIVHNSGTRQGNARVFDVYHKRIRKMQNGLAYHFVIGNGNSSGNGEIEIGNRWTRQINGGHVASDYLNDIALGICLVGDLNRDTPTKDQLGALDELCTYLRGRVGKVKGKPATVLGHKEINPKPTDCPGDRFPLGWLRKKFSN